MLRAHRPIALAALVPAIVLAEKPNPTVQSALDGVLRKLGNAGAAPGPVGKATPPPSP